jgi:hypothetical protein
VSLSRRRLRTLRGIEHDLAVSDPGLNALFQSFAARAGGREMPPVEHIAPWPGRMLARLWRGRSAPERVTDWHAGNRNDP